MKRMKRISERGFSMLEIVMAIILFAILAVGISTTTSYAKRAQVRGLEKMTAIPLLEKEMNQLRQQGARSLVVGVTQRATTKAVDGLNGNLTTTITADDNPADKRIDVHLDWTGNDGKSYSSALAAFMFQE